MNSAAESEMPDQRRWTRSGWLTLVVLILAAHLGLLFAFGARNPITPRAVAHVPVLRLADNTNELIALNDPTLFCWPHPRDFTSPFRAPPSVTPPPSFRSTEPLSWLLPSAEALGADFEAFMQTNRFASLRMQLKPALRLSRPAMPIAPLLPETSRLQIEGGLTQRPLLAPLDVPSLSYTNVLAPSIVQTAVNAAGNVISVVLLPSGSGWDQADRRALELARAARFAPGPPLTIGRLIFHWHTFPPTVTNAPAVTNEPGR